MNEIEYCQKSGRGNNGDMPSKRQEQWEVREKKRDVVGGAKWKVRRDGHSPA